MREFFNDGWKFHKGNPDSEYADIKKTGTEFKEVTLPHDWAIERFETFYEDARGWYIKRFTPSLKDGERLIIYFDGVYMDSAVYLNGIKIYEWKYGYTPFEIDLTDNLVSGENEIAISVTYLNPNSRWYSGAGITRNVYIDTVKDIFIRRNGIYVNAVPESSEDGTWRLSVDTELSLAGNSAGIKEALKGLNADEISKDLLITLKDESDTSVTIEHVSSKIIDGEDDVLTIRNIFTVKNPVCWDIDETYLYTLSVKYKESGEEVTTLGFKEVKLTTDKGLFLNGRHLKLNGVCEHHDFGMIGGDFYEDAFERKLLRLKDMGVNAIRFAHNPTDPKVLSLCDRIGVLIISEGFDMWEHSKTNYDYARFFHDWHERDVRAWVRQDRNHPCLLMWSIGNEIYDIHLGEEGRKTANILNSHVRKYDPLHNGYLTFGSNYMPWENAQKCAEDMEVVGYNYAENYYKDHHKEHPDWIIYGSETSSIVYSRGVYRFPFEVTCMSDDDSQCSCLGNSATSWGAQSLEDCIVKDRDMEFSLGQFIWSGHDYLGEPTPYHTKNSYFGVIDTAGYPKASYYGWKGAWTDHDKAPFVYIAPDWDHNESQIIDVRVMSNAPAVELFINGRSLGKQYLCHEPNSGNRVIADYKLPYEAGKIEAYAYNEKGDILCSAVRTSYGDTAEVVCKEAEYSLNGKPYKMGTHNTYGRHLKFFDVYALDKDGNIVSNASDMVKITVKGGELVACDNGDSTDYADQKADIRCLFKGKLLVTVMTDGITNPEVKAELVKENIPVRRIDLKCEGATKLGPDNKLVKVHASLCPANANDRCVTFKVTDNFGNDSSCAEIKENNFDKDGSITIEAKGDGEFKLRAFSKSGTCDVRVISELNFTVEGLGESYKDPYKFISGSVYTKGYGTVTSGNERGVATARGAETVVVFEGVDFGVRGSDEMIIPIFALDSDRVDIDIYDGDFKSPDCECILNGVYDKPRIWNVYQEETFKLLKRLTGVHTLSFRTTEKIHLKGFSCIEYNPAYEVMRAVDALKIYGDTFTLKEDMVAGIGNNVTIDFGYMDFGVDGPSKITAYGLAHGNRNTVHIRFSGENGDRREIMEWDPAEDFAEKTFNIEGISGYGKIELIFLPGCDFDLKWLRFGKDKN